MAAHVIQQVRDAIVSALQAQGNGLSATNVFPYKGRPLDSTKTPYLYVRTRDDVDERMALGYPAEERIIATFEIIIVVFQTGDFEAAALDLRKQVELALLGSTTALTLGGKAQMLTRTGAHVEEDDSSGTKPTYAIHLNFEAQIRHQESQPDVLMN